MKRIALVYPVASGGVKSVISRLSKGLKLEGFDVDLLSLGNRMPLIVIKDLAMLKLLANYDVVLYLGSIPWPSHMFLENVGVFVHGFVRHELLNSMKCGHLHTRLTASILLTLWNISRALNRIKFFVCHSITTCEMNDLPLDRVAILPQFVLPDEVIAALDIQKSFKVNGKSEIRILTYTSFARSPRLLSVESILWLVKVVAKQTNKKLKFIIVNPTTSTYQVKHFSNLTVMQIKFVPKYLFFKMILSSDLYIERCIDEELGYSAIEAGLLGTPIAKITYSRYVSRQDYNEDIIILASTTREFINKLIEFVNNIEYYKEYYSKKIRDFIVTKRVWDAVKHNFIKRLRHAE